MAVGVSWVGALPELCQATAHLPKAQYPTNFQQQTGQTSDTWSHRWGFIHCGLENSYFTFKTQSQYFLL